MGKIGVRGPDCKASLRALVEGLHIGPMLPIRSHHGRYGKNERYGSTPLRPSFTSFPSCTWERLFRGSCTAARAEAKSSVCCRWHVCEVQLRQRVRSQVKLGNEKTAFVLKLLFPLCSPRKRRFPKGMMRQFLATLYETKFRRQARSQSGDWEREAVCPF